MDTKKTEPQNEFSFLQEKVVPHRKNKVKKMVLVTLFTAFLASLFGVIARVVFITTEGPLLKYLGINTTERSELLFPTEGQETVTPTQAVTAAVTPDPTPTQEPEKVPSTTIIEKKINATIKDYEKIVSNICIIAQNAEKSLMTVTAVHSSKDWMDELNESRQNTTGVILGDNDAELLVLTTYSKVKDATRIELDFFDGSTVNGRIFNYDEDYNLAVIAVSLFELTQVQKEQIKPASLGESYSVSAGAPIVALGQPNGIRDSMELGLITGKGDSYYIMDNQLDYFTTDVSNYTESDGVILNLQGYIIGWITQNLSNGKTNQVSTAVGITRLKPVIEKLVNQYDMVYCGTVCENLPDSVLEKLSIEYGVYVLKVIPDSPAFEAGIKNGDIITGIDEKTVDSVSDYASILNNLSPEDIISIHVLRQYKGELKPMDFTVTLGKKQTVLK